MREENAAQKVDCHLTARHPTASRSLAAADVPLPSGRSYGAANGGRERSTWDTAIRKKNTHYSAFFPAHTYLNRVANSFLALSSFGSDTART